MKMREDGRSVRGACGKMPRPHFVVAGVFVLLVLFFGLTNHIAVAQDASQAPAEAAKTPAAMGTIKSISGNSLVVTSDAGADVIVDVRESTKIVRVAPGMKDLKDAQTIRLADLQVGDRLLIRGSSSNGGMKFMATSIVAMKKADVAEQHNRERATWQTSGVGGLVNSVNAAAGVIGLTVPSLREKKIVTVHISSQTILRRYAQGSVKFSDAKPALLSEIRPGDQLRARGEKNADGSELTAFEVVSGSFRNVSGTISSLDSAQGTITVHDLATKKPVTVKITSESQLRKLAAPLAQRLAQHFIDANGVPNGERVGGGGPSASGAPAAKEPASPAGGPPSASPNPGDESSVGSGARGRGIAPGGGGMDLQQIILRMPAVTIADLQKDDAVMLVGTEGSDNITAITLVAGVEPILQRSPNGGASSILWPWSLSGAPGGEAGTP